MVEWSQVIAMSVVALLPSMIVFFSPSATSCRASPAPASRAKEMLIDGLSLPALLPGSPNHSALQVNLNR